MYDPLVLSSRQTLMQRVCDYVRTGHVHWTTGEVSLGRAADLARKFARLYAVDLDRNRRFRAKQHGDADAALLWYEPFPGAMTLRWVLLVTPGEHPAHQLEHLQDASTRDGRMQLFDYELVHLTKRVKVATKSTATAPHPVSTSSPERAPRTTPKLVQAVLTWRMRADVYESWRERALAVARGNNTYAMQQFLEELYRVPGFFGARQQVGKVAALFRREYRRRHGSSAGCPKLLQLRYVMRRPDRGTRLSQLRVAAATQVTSPELGTAPSR